MTNEDLARLDQKHFLSVMATVGHLSDQYQAMFTDHRMMVSENDHLKAKLKDLEETVELLARVIHEQRS